MYIEEDKYFEILGLMPFCCVDVVIHREGKVLLLKRKQEESFGDQWWVPGGRVLKNETMHRAVIRKCKEEAGLIVVIERQTKSYDCFSDFHKIPSGLHCITTGFVVRPLNDNIEINEFSEDYRWVDSIEEDWHPLLKQIIVDADVLRRDR